MKIVIGLGNPGTRYRETRHNLGFRVVDVLAGRRGKACGRRGELADMAWTCELTIGGEDVLLVKPRTFMNRSGRAGAAACRAKNAEARDLVVVHDDADMELGRVRVRPEGGAGGHNGIRSLMAAFGTGAFTRVKLGVRGRGREDRDLADYVLDEFEDGERPLVESMIETGADAVEAVIETGLAEAMNAFNGRLSSPSDGEEAEGSRADERP